jgi:hypothetical protein
MIQRRAITQAVRVRYRKATKSRKSAILDAFCEDTDYNRSYARRVMGAVGKAGRKKSHYGPRKRIYDASVFYPLRTLWIAADGICGQRFQPFIP